MEVEDVNKECNGCVHLPICGYVDGACGYYREEGQANSELVSKTDELKKENEHLAQSCEKYKNTIGNQQEQLDKVENKVVALKKFIDYLLEQI